MSQFIVFICTIFFSFNLLASEKVPRVKAEQFEVGNFWVWNISNKEGLFSREKYKVISRENDRIVIEMSTAYYNQETFHIHHRFTVDLRDCERAHLDPRVKVEFNIDLARFLNGTWERPLAMHGRAFEEKFNCNGHVHKKNWRYQTDFKDVVLGDNSVRSSFKQTHKLDQADQLNGWYSLESGPLAGIMVEKTFNAGTESEFLSKLTSWEMAPY